MRLVTCLELCMMGTQLLATYGVLVQRAALGARATSCLISEELYVASSGLTAQSNKSNIF